MAFGGALQFASGQKAGRAQVPDAKIFAVPLATNPP